VIPSHQWLGYFQGRGSQNGPDGAFGEIALPAVAEASASGKPIADKLAGEPRAIFAQTPQTPQTAQRAHDGSNAKCKMAIVDE
jgi:hypothetical protein